jgi:methanogenic corrinoid protein MtbC1
MNSQATLDALAREVPAVSREAASAYARLSERMLERMNQRMEATPELDEMIGSEALDLMRANHRHHVDLMGTVFRYGAGDLLDRTLAWVYRSYYYRGFTATYFQQALQAWSELVVSVLPPESALPVRAVYQWILEHHSAFEGLGRFPPDSFDPLPVRPERDHWDAACDQFVDALLQPDVGGCMQLADELVDSPADLQALYLRVLHPAMVRVGRLWETGQASVAQEHLASSLVARVMSSSIYSRYVLGQCEKGRALVSAAPNEFHELGARMVADFLEMDGWDVRYLGANTPAPELISMVAATDPDLVLLSVGMSFNLGRTEALIRRLKASGGRFKTMVGGLAFLHAQDAWRQVGADAFAPDPAAAVVESNRLLVR